MYLHTKTITPTLRAIHTHTHTHSCNYTNTQGHTCKHPHTHSDTQWPCSLSAHLPEGSECARQARGQDEARRLLPLRLGLLLGLAWVWDPGRGGRRGLIGAEQGVLGLLGVAGCQGGLLALQAAWKGVRLAARAHCPGTGTRNQSGAGTRTRGCSPLAGVRGDEVRARPGDTALQVVGLRAAEGGGWPEVAQVVGTGRHSVLAGLEGQQRAL